MSYILIFGYPLLGTVVSKNHDFQKNGFFPPSNEEQKYRFNQFWDITDDRGEFTGVERPIWITTLNGYIIATIILSIFYTLCIYKIFMYFWIYF